MRRHPSCESGSNVTGAPEKSGSPRGHTQDELTLVPPTINRMRELATLLAAATTGLGLAWCFYRASRRRHNANKYLALAPDQCDAFWRDGYVAVKDAVDQVTLKAILADIDGWVQESRKHAGAFGTISDGRPRFDVEDDHTADRPAVRRVQSPTELSEHCLAALRNSRLMDAAVDIIGPNIRFHHSKINLKLPGSSTKVQWHQDFCFECAPPSPSLITIPCTVGSSFECTRAPLPPRAARPPSLLSTSAARPARGSRSPSRFAFVSSPHSNEDVLVLVLFLDAQHESNGPLEMAPGSHRGPLHSLFDDEGVFVGKMSATAAAAHQKTARRCLGAAGDAVLMHIRTAHASGANCSDDPRRLFISCVAAADAVPLAPNAVPSRHEGMLLRGVEPQAIRCTARFQMRMPRVPKGASFFLQQANADGPTGPTTVSGRGHPGVSNRENVPLPPTEAPIAPPSPASPTSSTPRMLSTRPEGDVQCFDVAVGMPPDGAVRALATDGVVCLRNAMSREWIELVEAGIEAALDPATAQAEDVAVIQQAKDAGSFKIATQSWASSPEFKEAIYASRLPDLVWQATASKTLTLYYDFLLIKEAHAARAITPWHQDHACNAPIRSPNWGHWASSRSPTNRLPHARLLLLSLALSPRVCMCALQIFRCKEIATSTPAG